MNAYIGSYTRCYACKMPLSIDDTKDLMTYEEGVCCKYCKGNILSYHTIMYLHCIYIFQHIWLYNIYLYKYVL